MRLGGCEFDPRLNQTKDCKLGPEYSGMCLRWDFGGVGSPNDCKVSAATMFTNVIMGDIGPSTSLKFE